MNTALAIIVFVFIAVLIWFTFSVGFEIKTTLKRIEPLLVWFYAFFNQPPKEGAKPSDGKEQPADKGVDYKKEYPEGCTDGGAEDDY